MPLKLLLIKTGVVGYITMHPLMKLGEPYMWDALHTLKLLEVHGSTRNTQKTGRAGAVVREPTNTGRRGTRKTTKWRRSNRRHVVTSKSKSRVYTPKTTDIEYV